MVEKGLILLHCSNCGSEIGSEAKFCQSCGGSTEVTKGIDTTHSVSNESYSNKQSIAHFAFLCAISFGLYEIFWFYKYWKYIKERKQLNIAPVWRALFSIFFAYNLFQYIYSLAKEKGYKEMLSPGWLAFAYIALSLCWRLPEPLSLISVLSFVPIIQLQKACNYLWDNEEPMLKERTRFSIGEILLIVFGSIFWALVLIGMFMPGS